MTDRRGNIRKEASVHFREPPETVETNPSPVQRPPEGRRRSVLTKLFARKKTDRQESTLVKASTSLDDSNPQKSSV